MRLHKKGDIIIFCSTKLTVTRDQLDNTIRCEDREGKQIVIFQPFLKVAKKKKAGKRKKKAKNKQLTVS